MASELTKLPLGNPGDELKIYERQNDSDYYAPYQMTYWVESPDFVTMRVAVDKERIGSTFLSELPRIPSEEDAVIPDTGFSIILEVSDGSAILQYYFFSNGMIFTQQDGKCYYMGTNRIMCTNHAMGFYGLVVDTVATGQNSRDESSFPHTYEIESLPKTFSSDSRIEYIYTGYGDIWWATQITNQAHKDYILELVNTAITTAPIASLDIAGINNLRIFSNNDCYDFALNKGLLSSYSGDDHTHFSIPNDAILNIQNIAVYAIAEKIKL